MKEKDLDGRVFEFVVEITCSHATIGHTVHVSVSVPLLLIFFTSHPIQAPPFVMLGRCCQTGTPTRTYLFGYDLLATFLYTLNYCSVI